MATYASAYSSYQHPQGQQPPAKPQYGGQQKPNPTWIKPPYPGAPPVPAGMSVNPQQWKAGRWQYNPAWNQNHNPKQQHIPWIPSHHWMPHLNQQSNSSASHSQQQQQVVNPYKRVPRPPSAEYLATELVANPLGLTGLDEPNKYYDKAQTPWVWQPRDLDDEDQDSPSQEQGSDDPSGQSRRNSGGTTDEPESFTARRELQPTFSINIVRTPEHYRHLSSGSLPSTPSRGSSRGSMDIVPARMSQLSIGSSGGSQGSIGSSNPNSSDFPPSSSILGGDQLSDEPSSILSPLIIAHTPKPATRGLRNHYTHPLINSGGLDPIPESTIDPRAAPTRQAPIGHASSLPILSTSQGYAVAQPSPLRDDDRERREKRDRKDRKDKKERPDHHDWRGLGSKHTTFIDPYTSNVYSSNPTRSPPQNHSPATASSHSTPSSQSSQPSPSYPATHASSPSSYSPGPSPPQRKSKQSPPDDNRALHPQSSPATAKSIKPETSTLHGQQIPVQPPPLFVKRPSFETYDNRRRRGYWNRRGDHLTQSGYIVYAPPGKQFPQELRNYPTEDEGYENHDNLFTANTARPELPESLARGGKPPEKPYDSFVIYEYQ